MTEDQLTKCHAIIHTHAAAAGAGNALPAPGAGTAADLVAMTSMAVSLCAVFGGKVQEEAAKGIAYATFKNTVLRQPLKTISKELSKLLPFLGQVIGPAMSFAMLEAAGWSIARELEEAAAHA
jgi:uncharacterized protein (DUF697 family)